VERVACLLDQARRAGLSVQADGGRLVIRGPKRADEIARRLLDRKAEVLAELAGTPVPWLAAEEAAASLFHYEPGKMKFGDVCAGWTPKTWAVELRRKASCCRDLHADTADIYTRWAEDIERRLVAP
jgi:hypothetical protein